MTGIVETLQGKLQGVEEEGVRVYRGVPFAAPPVGERRFRAPAPVEPWQGVRSAATSADASWQINPSNAQKVLGIVETFGDNFPGVRLAPPFATSTYAQPTISEDCLYLDIWVPEHAPTEALPVYIYYHGGANVGSSGSQWLERGAALAREERIIVVRPSYRLGALGWVHFGLVSDALGEAVNLGVQDQIAALRWVSDNIGHFGGDPDNITVGGESAGATAVSHLLTNPAARGLFRRAIIQSLSPFNQWGTQSRQDAVAVVELFLQILGIADAAAIRDIDPDHLLAVNQALQRFFVADKNGAWRPLGAVVDGVIVPRQPAVYLSQADLDGQTEVMIGFAKDEWQFFRGHSPTLQSGTQQDFVRILAQVCGEEEAQRLFAAYASLYPDHDAPHLIGDAMSFEFFKHASLKIAENLSGQGVRTYVFQFSYDLPGAGGQVRAYHTGDTPLIWRNYSPEDLARWPAFEGVDREELDRSAKAFGAMYGSFIRTGDPGPGWPAYEHGEQQILWLGKVVEARRELLRSELDAFAAAGLSDVSVLEARLAGNVRTALCVPARAYAAPRD